MAIPINPHELGNFTERGAVVAPIFPNASERKGALKGFAISAVIVGSIALLSIAESGEEQPKPVYPQKIEQPAPTPTGMTGAKVGFPKVLN